MDRNGKCPQKVTGYPCKSSIIRQKNDKDSIYNKKCENDVSAEEGHFFDGLYFPGCFSFIFLITFMNIRIIKTKPNSIPTSNMAGDVSHLRSSQ